MKKRAVIFLGLIFIQLFLVCIVTMVMRKELGYQRPMVDFAKFLLRTEEKDVEAVLDTPRDPEPTTDLDAVEVTFAVGQEGSDFFSKSWKFGQVDLVYTWVNGSDPRQQKDLEDAITNDEDFKAKRDHEERCKNFRGGLAPRPRWRVPSFTSQIASRNRFEDNNELIYSMRSIDMYAPWIRHVWIVTNGQIPSWLNLQNPRVSIVTHKQIFLNHSHLPTFSSTAIELNLHRIPGIAPNVLYMNDDFMLLRPLFPTDFMTGDGFHKIHREAVVGNCAEGCRAFMVADGICDPVCNKKNCYFDGGDCGSEEERKEFRQKMQTKDPCDTYGEVISPFVAAGSNQILDSLFTQMFDRRIRHFISHAPYFFQLDKVADMNRYFEDRINYTIAHKLRTKEDFQPAFGYNYFLADCPVPYNASKVWNTLDKNEDGILESTELNALVQLLRQDRRYVNASENTILSVISECGVSLSNRTLSENAFKSCSSLNSIVSLLPNITREKKYRTIIKGNVEGVFLMLSSNIMLMKKVFKTLGRDAPKWICVNDDKDYTKQYATEHVEIMYRDFMNRKFPFPSQFELPKGQTNKYLRVEDIPADELWKYGFKSTNKTRLE